jgi:hypothetical protein
MKLVVLIEDSIVRRILASFVVNDDVELHPLVIAKCQKLGYKVKEMPFECPKTTQQLSELIRDNVSADQDGPEGEWPDPTTSFRRW